ncbi:Copper amine oxidase N-terminal domain-containing protein [Paenibacillus sp. 1_12]|uniref:copper amine oxidase N-terminal domain-containing protein n=1 Tax=Paenibacillus sp. 1_12 TaxID=1566278 RepID=UPI0008EB9922|nr:copper amine oxidase N-terminal domain-containing protein [Paenibacillus sp. 1_12]SFL20850.1 Copper amine oxidase N-terminal domain-containing protein [Paenibacillus sp. 1_12]
MRKITSTVLALLLMLTLIVPSAFAESTKASASYTEVTVTIDGKQQVFDQQSAILMDGSTLVPMRSIFERLGATITWNQQTQTVTGIKDTTKIVLTIGKTTATVDGKIVQLAKEAVVLNGSTLVPLRFVSEALGATVGWDNATNTATINSVDGTVVITPPASNVVNGIKVQFGKHDYASKSQKEYGKVMEIINKAMDGYKNKSYYDSYPQKQAYVDYYFNGVKWNGTFDTDYDSAVFDAQQNVKTMKAAGITDLNVMLEVIQLRHIAIKLAGGSAVVVQKPGVESAYQLLVGGENDCDSYAQTLIAIFDSAGYSTAIQASATHADALVKIQGSWFNLSTGVDKVASIPTATTLASSNGSYLLVTPTY